PDVETDGSRPFSAKRRVSAHPSGDFMLRLAVPKAFAMCLILAASGAFAQSSEGTPEEQDAYHRDAVRFCKDAIPDTFKVLTCLESTRTKIREACRAVLRSHGVLEPAPKNEAPIDR